MYGMFTYIWMISMVNVGKYTIHGSYGIQFGWIVISTFVSKGKAAQWTILQRFAFSARCRWGIIGSTSSKSPGGVGWRLFHPTNGWNGIYGMFKKSYIRRSWYHFFLRSICLWRFCCLLPLGGKCFLSQCLGVSLLLKMHCLITLLNQVIVLVVLCHRRKKHQKTVSDRKPYKMHTHVLNSVSLLNSSTWQALSFPYVWKWNGTSPFWLISQRCHCVFSDSVFMIRVYSCLQNGRMSTLEIQPPLFLGDCCIMWQALSALPKAFGETWRKKNTCRGFCGRWELEMVKWPPQNGWFP